MAVGMEGAIDEMTVAAFGQGAGLDLLAQFETALAEQLVDGQGDVAAGLAHDQHALAFLLHGARAFQEVLQVDHREQVAAQVAHAQQPGLRAGHRGHRRHRHDFHHFAEIGHQPALAHAEADATPEVLGELPPGQLHRMGQAAPFVGFKNVEGRTHQATSSLIRAIRSSSRGGLTM